MGQSTEQEAEWLVGLRERFNGIKLPDVQAMAEKALEDPSVQKTLKEAGVSLETAREKLPGIIESEVRAISQVLEKKIEQRAPELAQETGDFRIPEEVFSAARENVESRIQDMQDDLPEMMKGMIDDIVRDAVENFPDRVKQQFEEELAAEKANVAQHNSDAVKSLVKTLFDDCQPAVGKRGQVAGMIPALRESGKFGQDVIEELNKRLVAEGMQPFEDNKPEVAPLSP